MKGSPRALRRVRTALADHFELLLTAAGVLFAITLTFTELASGQHELALTFLVWLQGLLLWAVRRHTWFRQRALVRQLRLMLQDRINSQLTVLLDAVDSHGEQRGTRLEHERQEAAREAALTVAQELERLSLDTLRTWQQRSGRNISMALG